MGEARRVSPITESGTWIEECVSCGGERWASESTTGTPCFDCTYDPGLDVEEET